MAIKDNLPNSFINTFERVESIDKWYNKGNRVFLRGTSTVFSQ